MDGFERITGREHDGLVEKCQENGWLKVRLRLAGRPVPRGVPLRVLPHR